ncbi:MAG TPA: transglycosylase SLT domain-containing protein [Acetobacteraceae bacterium]|nr:transglycosylase SLT domain-containing protein [Acetobacteraceae bacterium]
MPNNTYDDLFDAWGRALNVNPQLGKTVFHMESSGGKNTGKSLPEDPDSPIGPMQMRPSTAAGIAKSMNITGPIDLQDMRFVVPLAMRYLADGLNATQSGNGALAYYYSGSADPAAWGRKTQAYVAKGQALYPTMALTPAQSQQTQQAADAPPEQP